MSWRLFLDDERFPPAYNWWYRIKAFFGREQKWVICRDYESACKAVSEMGLPFFVSFDHDLGQEKTGYDVAHFLVDYCLDRDIKPAFEYCVHSQNPVGRDRIIGLLDRFKEFKK